MSQPNAPTLEGAPLISQRLGGRSRLLKGIAVEVVIVAVLVDVIVTATFN